MTDNNDTSSDIAGEPGHTFDAPAFPQNGLMFKDKQLNGMTLRDYFAGQALSLSLAEIHEGAGAEIISRRCYMVADAMLRARELTSKDKSNTIE